MPSRRRDDGKQDGATTEEVAAQQQRGDGGLGSVITTSTVAERQRQACKSGERGSGDGRNYDTHEGSKTSFLTLVPTLPNMKQVAKAQSVFRHILERKNCFMEDFCGKKQGVDKRTIF